MNDSNLLRREFLVAATGSLAAWPAAAYARRPLPADQPHAAQPTRKGQSAVKAISSHNGLRATRRAYEAMLEGSDTLDAAVAGVAIVEDDPDDISVGFGGLPNENGVVELDAAVMHGPTHRAGAVAALQNTRNPARLAQLVMEQTDHVLLVGKGAVEFARACGFPKEDLLTEKARKIWLYWKQNLSQQDDWLAPPPEDVDPDVARFFKLDRKPAGKPVAPQKATSPTPKSSSGSPPPQTSQRSVGERFERPTGTIHCAAMNAHGDLSCVTSTSGLAFKLPGRVGDSPIIGAGLYVDNAVGSCGSTGRGEANLQNLCCFAAVELMRNGLAPADAGMEVLRRVAAHTTESHLLDDAGRPNFGLKFYLLAKDGRHAGVTMWGPADFAVTDPDGTRLEKCLSLYVKGT